MPNLILSFWSNTHNVNFMELQLKDTFGQKLKTDANIR